MSHDDEAFLSRLAALEAERDALVEANARLQVKVEGARAARVAKAAAKYPTVLQTIKGVAYHHGYAVAVHGSEARDLDLVAVPWVEGAMEPAALVDALCAALAVDVYNPPERRLPTMKPHGRRAWALQLGGGLYVDLSITPVRSPESEATRATLEWFRTALQEIAASRVPYAGRTRHEAIELVEMAESALDGAP